jgi:hypothetical protein
MAAEKEGERAVGRLIELVLMIAPESADLMCVGMPTLVCRLDEWVEKVADDEAACIGETAVRIVRVSTGCLSTSWAVLDLVLDSGWR